VKIDGFTEEKTQWGLSDVRFVQKQGAVYAFLMGAKGGETVTLRSFADVPVAAVDLLGYGPVPFRKELGVLVVQLPDNLPALCANALKVR
jgi:alpha-L-fucosidase